jgi:GR25 family glycosyltransferase involved in LPS biosynthesis
MLIDVIIIHHKGLSERLPALLRCLDKSILIRNYTIITEEFEDNDFFARHKFFYDIFNDSRLPLPRKLRAAEKSVYAKHFKALEIASKKCDPVIIFEDDVSFNPKKIDKFIINNVFSSFPYDLIFFGTGIHSLQEKIGFHRRSEFLCTRCADSYVILPEAALKLYLHILDIPPLYPYDWDLCPRIAEMNLKIYWLSPGITEQGSQKNYFKSAIQDV